MPIIEIYNCSKKISKSEFNEISSAISLILSIDSSLVWFIQHKISDSNIHKGNLYNSSAPIVFFNAREKHNKDRVLECLKLISKKCAAISGCKSEQIFCGIRRIIDDEILQPSP